MTRKAPLPDELSFVLRHTGVQGVLLGFFTVAVVAGTYALAYWWPIHGRMERLESEVAELRQRATAGALAREAAGAMETAERDLREARERLSAGAGQAELVERTFDLAKKNGLTVAGESNRSRTLENGYHLFVQELSLRGSYGQFRSFFAGLPRLPTWTVVREVRLEAGAGGDRLEGTVTLGTLRKPPENRPKEDP